MFCSFNYISITLEHFIFRFQYIDPFKLLVDSHHGTHSNIHYTFTISNTQFRRSILQETPYQSIFYNLPTFVIGYKAHVNQNTLE